ncbi:SDR family NAD(P)-dependent oxidoreductase [Bacteroidota bacterium]
MKNYTLITGGSKGIGKALARECASRGMNLLLVARQKEGLEEASRNIREEFKVRVETLQADLRGKDTPQKILDWCLREGYPVNVLINNAGIGGTTRFETSSPEYSSERIMVNVHALVQLTRLFIPELKKYKRSYILNMGSMSAYYPLAYKSVYSASKAFVMYFTRAINEELRGSQISITLSNPNGVRTNKGTLDRIDSHGRLINRFLILEAEKIARITIDKMLMGKLVVIPGFMNRLLILFARITPRGIRERNASRIFRKELMEK